MNYHLGDLMKIKISLLSLILCFSFSVNIYADQTIIVKKVDNAPIIDGDSSDPVWNNAIEIITHDNVADIDVSLKSAYTDKDIFFLVSFPDPTESREHKTYFWDSDLEMYKTGPEREDCFIFKWNMELNPVDLSLDSDNPYEADLWFWKANRTDPAGFADDKKHILRITSDKTATKRISKSGNILFLSRPGDEGTPAYNGLLHEEYKGDKLPKYENIIPTGSRADVKAKGTWKEGRWTIEFSRALNTGQSDDVQFNVPQNFQFGISRFESAGTNPNPNQDQPLYGAGEVSETLYLNFEQ